MAASLGPQPAALRGLACPRYTSYQVYAPAARRPMRSGHELRTTNCQYRHRVLQASLPGSTARQPGQAQLHRQRRAVCVHAHSAQSNYDAEEELDADLAAELGRFRSPEAWQQVQQHMDLVWSVSRNRGSRAPCPSCARSGEAECHWCHGTGALMIGDTMFCSTEGHCNCPVCNGKGYLKCQECRGTGFRAAWMGGSGPIRT